MLKDKLFELKNLQKLKNRKVLNINNIRLQNNKHNKIRMKTRLQ